MNPRLPATLLISALLATGCSRVSQAEKDAAIDTVKRNVQSMQSEKIDDMMATIHPKSPAFGPTRAVMEDLAEKFDLKCEVSGIDILSATKDEMKIRFAQTMEKLEGDEDFPKKKVLGIHVLKKDGATWKIFDTQVLKMELLEPPDEAPEPPEPPAAPPVEVPKAQ